MDEQQHLKIQVRKILFSRNLIFMMVQIEVGVNVCIKFYSDLGTLSEKKRDYVGKIPKWRTPLPPVWETPVIKKKVGFIFHFRTSGTFLVFTKKSPFWVID